MLDWIANNKVLFTGLGTAVFAAVVALIKYFFKKPSAPAQVQRPAGNSVASQAGGNIQATRDINATMPSVAASDHTKIAHQVADAIVTHHAIAAGQNVNVYITNLYLNAAGSTGASASASLPGPTIKENQDA